VTDEQALFEQLVKTCQEYFKKKRIEAFQAQKPGEEDTILALSGLGKEVWEGVDPDAYVRGLREGWE